MSYLEKQHTSAPIKFISTNIQYSSVVPETLSIAKHIQQMWLIPLMNHFFSVNISSLLMIPVFGHFLVYTLRGEQSF